MWKREKKKINNKKNLIIQCVDWNTENIIIENDCDSSGDEENNQNYNNNNNNFIYNIKLFGITENEESICVDINNFTPHFYLEVPTNWTKRNTNSLKNYINYEFDKDDRHRKFKSDILSIGIVHRKKMYNFTNFTNFQNVREF